MKKETISEALCEIDERYVEEAVAHQPKKKSRLALRVGAMAASLLLISALTVKTVFTIKDAENGEITSGKITRFSTVAWMVQEGGVVWSRPISVGDETYRFTVWRDDQALVGERLEQMSATFLGDDSEVRIYALRGVSPEIAVCAFLENGGDYGVYYNFMHENTTLSSLWEATGICENVIFPSTINVYEYRTKKTTYYREYQANDSQLTDIRALLSEMDGEKVQEMTCFWERETPKRAVYFCGDLKKNRVQINIEDNGYLTISTSRGYWSETFHVGVENAVRLIDAIESLPRKEEKEVSTSYEETVTETTHVAETRGE
ncbi:MAG: hypothetical protein IJW87_04320 [Clostridia bacterium]|nr:hypothetical protein [Clostridia bacterium]